MTARIGADYQMLGTCYDILHAGAPPQKENIPAIFSLPAQRLYNLLYIMFFEED